jgi:hypothetical protein
VNFTASLRLHRHIQHRAQSRDCRSCHLNPAALGYGRGQLKYEVKGGVGRWIFSPAYPRSPQDGLPMDAWIGFLQEPRVGTTTRKDASSIYLARAAEHPACRGVSGMPQRKGATDCAVFADFKNYRAALSPQCRLPDWAFAGIAQTWTSLFDQKQPGISPTKVIGITVCRLHLPVRRK